jgi:hypothetical protein
MQLMFYMGIISPKLFDVNISHNTSIVLTFLYNRLMHV